MIDNRFCKIEFCKVDLYLDIKRYSMCVRLEEVFVIIKMEKKCVFKRFLKKKKVLVNNII